MPLDLEVRRRTPRPAASTCPAAWRMRPKFGSAPFSAVFTSGEFGDRARDGLHRVGRAADDHPPDPLGALAVGHDLHRELAQQRVERLAERELVRASRAPPPRRMRRPRARTRCRSWTAGRPREMRSKRALHAHAREQVERLGSSAASVCDEAEHRRVARRDHPRPLRLGGEPHACRPGSATSRQARFGQRSLVMIACGEVVRICAEPRTGRRGRRPSTGSRGSSVPITPVDATRHLVGLDPERLGGRGLHRDARSRARARPSPTFECPRWRPRRAGRPCAPGCDTTTGAPTRAFVVKRAADTVSGASHTSTPTSSPSGFSPAATPAARNPPAARWGRARSRGRARSTQRERKKSRAHPPSPAVSGRPSIRFRSCTAWPAAPFQRLSIAAERDACDRRTTVTWIRQRLLSRTSPRAAAARPPPPRTARRA